MLSWIGVEDLCHLVQGLHNRALHQTPFTISAKLSISWSLNEVDKDCSSMLFWDAIQEEILSKFETFNKFAPTKLAPIVLAIVYLGCSACFVYNRSVLQSYETISSLTGDVQKFLGMCDVQKSCANAVRTLDGT